MTNVKSATPHTTTIAVLGTGIIGAPVARNLRKHSFDVRIWNRTRAKAEALKGCGIEIADTPADAVCGADIILTTLNDGPRVLETMMAAAGGFSRGAIWAQMSTVGLTALGPLAAFAEQQGLIFLDTPIQGTRQPAEQGQLIIIASGPEQARARIQPVFDAIGKRTVWVSDDATTGTSSRLKLALNNWAFALTHGIAESIAIAEGLGVDPALFVDVVKGGPMDNLYFQLKTAAILSDDYTTSFSVTNAEKDSRLIVEAAQEAGIQVDTAVAGLNRFRRALDAGHGDKDMAASFLASTDTDRVDVIRTDDDRLPSA